MHIFSAKHGLLIKNLQFYFISDSEIDTYIRCIFLARASVLSCNCIFHQCSKMPRIVSELVNVRYFESRSTKNFTMHRTYICFSILFILSNFTYFHARALMAASRFQACFSIIWKEFIFHYISINQSILIEENAYTMYNQSENSILLIFSFKYLAFWWEKNYSYLFQIE